MAYVDADGEVFLLSESHVVVNELTMFMQISKILQNLFILFVSGHKHSIGSLNIPFRMVPD